MWWLSLLENLAKGFKESPLPYMLAAAVVSLAWVVRGQRKDLIDARKELREANAAALAQERQFRAEVDGVRREHMDQLAMLSTTTNGVLQMKAELEGKLEQLPKPRPRTHARKTTASELATVEPPKALPEGK